MRFELVLNGFVGEVGFEASGKKQAEFVIEADESLIEGCVVQTVEGDTVADVEAFCLVAAPREDVGGDEEFADRQAGDGAAVVVVVENDVPEVVLTPALFGESDRFGFTTWRSGDPADASARDDFGGLGIRLDEEGIEAFLAERDEFGRVLVEFVPDGAVEVAGSLEAFDAAKFECRVEGGEVAEFHRHSAGCASNSLG